MSTACKHCLVECIIDFTHCCLCTQEHWLYPTYASRKPIVFESIVLGLPVTLCANYLALVDLFPLSIQKWIGGVCDGWFVGSGLVLRIPALCPQQQSHSHHLLVSRPIPIIGSNSTFACCFYSCFDCLYDIP